MIQMFINGKYIELADGTSFAQTKQVNDIAKLSDRQSNYTVNVLAPYTANNVRAMEFVFMVGNQSNIPYQKNSAFVIDTESGECLIYNGWATIRGLKKGYEIYVHDGNIDFYRAIENHVITDAGITELDHLKNIASVVDSWTNPALNYKYIIADYNGKNTYISPSTAHFIAINIDYQVPSVRASFLFDKIMNFSGFTYTGSFLTNPKYINLWMTYPKPVPTFEPVVQGITHQESVITSREVIESSGGGTFTSTVLECKLLPIGFTTAEASNELGGGLISTLGFKVTQNGAYRIRCYGSLTTSATTSGIITWRHYSGVTLLATGTFNAAIGESVILNVNIGERISLFPPLNSASGISTPAYLAGGFTTDIDLVLGYDASFSDALIDFEMKKYFNDILQRFGLTMFTDKDRNHVEFKTIKEIFENPNVLDWSRMFKEKIDERYALDNYAKINLFKYKYNEENDKFNDGFITIDNENIPAETTVVESPIYSPEKSNGFYGPSKSLWKVWNKEVKDDGAVDYKELTGRFYFMRFLTFITTLKIGSESLNTEAEVTQFPVCDFSRMKFSEIIEDNYLEIGSILNKAKLIQATFDLNITDFNKYDFKGLIYIEQLSSNYLVNKILNFKKNKPVTLELIEVDYKSTITIPPVEDGTVITITGIEKTLCDVTITFTTDVILPAFFEIYAVVNTFGFPSTEPLPTYFEYRLISTNTFTITLPSGQFWIIYMKTQLSTGEYLLSNFFYFENTDTCIVEPPITDCDPETLVISNLDKFNVGSPLGGALNNRSGWNFNKVFTGLTQDGNLFDGFNISSLCRPYSYRVEINSSLGLQIVTHLVDGLTMETSFDGFSITTDGRPTSGTFQLFYINSIGTEFASNILTF